MFDASRICGAAGATRHCGKKFNGWQVETMPVAFVPLQAMSWETEAGASGAPPLLR
jgi:hypothetical protein